MNIGFKICFYEGMKTVEKFLKDQTGTEIEMRLRDFDHISEVYFSAKGCYDTVITRRDLFGASTAVYCWAIGACREAEVEFPFESIYDVTELLLKECKPTLYEE